MPGFSVPPPHVPADFKNTVALVGVGDTDYGSMYRTTEPTRNPYTLGLRAFKDALEDCGLDKDEIDGLIVVRIPSYDEFARLAGLRSLRHANAYQGAGRMSGVAITTAASLIYSGQCKYVACVYGNDGRTVGATYGGGEGGNPYETPFGMTSPGAECAMMFRRYMHMYGATEGTLGALSISNRYHATMNPRAVMRDPLDMEKYMAARYIAAPLRLYDYCLINDGACAIIVTSVERAQDLKKRPVRLAATAQGTDFGTYYATDDFFRDAIKDCFDRIMPAAGMTHRDIKTMSCYDNFTPTIVFALEGAGFCEYGEGWQYIQNGNTTVGTGRLPINTNGGHTSESYMQGWGLHIELIRQLRGGEVDPRRQVPDCDVAAYVCPAPICNAHILVRG
jgi:acetyl-CoA acetyltransferase